MANVKCPKCGSRNTIVKKKCDFSESDFEVQSKTDGFTRGANKDMTDIVGDVLKIAGKLVDWWIDSNKQMIYCKNCGHYGELD